METRRTILRWSVFVAALTFAIAGSRGADSTSFVGEISDSQCAMNVHSLHRSHADMLATGAAGTTAADCTRYCVRERGGRYVLQTKHDVYKLSDQKMPEPFAGEKVKVFGTLDPQTNMIQVQDIEPITK